MLSTKGRTQVRFFVALLIRSDDRIEVLAYASNSVAICSVIGELTVNREAPRFATVSI